MSPPDSAAHPLVHRGELVSIYALRLADGSCPALEFLEEELDDAERATMATSFKKLGMQRYIRNAERFHQVQGSDGVFEFKDHQVRLFACWAGKGRMFLLYGLRKKRNRLRPEAVKRAERMAAYAKQTGRG